MPLLFIAMQKSKTPLSIAERGFLRCLAESNRSTRFCRPVPNRSAKAPSLLDCKYTQNISLSKLSGQKFHLPDTLLNI